MLNPNKFLINEEGFTFVEVIIAILLFSILSLALFGIMGNTVLQTSRTQRQIETLENGRTALDFIIDEVRRAEGIRIDNLMGKEKIRLEINGDPYIVTSVDLPDVIFEYDGVKKQILYNGIVLADDIEKFEIQPASIDVDPSGGSFDGEYSKEVDKNEDGVMDKNLKIVIEAKIPADQYIETAIGSEIIGEVSLAYKKLLTY